MAGGDIANPDELVQSLRRRGLRATPQRRAIVEAVRAGGGHVTADSVFEVVRTELPTISLKTIYETLHALVAVDEMRPLVLGTGPTRFDTTVRPHHHVVCLGCNRIEDVDFDVDTVAGDQCRGFSVVRTDVTAWGFCPDCGDRVGEQRPNP